MSYVTNQNIFLPSLVFKFFDPFPPLNTQRLPESELTPWGGAQFPVHYRVSQTC